jgi:hypothetical protein
MDQFGTIYTIRLVGYNGIATEFQMDGISTYLKMAI